MSEAPATKRPFKQMDVFTAIPYSGNPLAVVVDGRGLSSKQMQNFASWTNLSETTFILPPTNPRAHYKVRIFTITRELPFAGHPTLGTCKAWLDSQPESSLKKLLNESSNQIIQECGIGLVQIHLEPETARLSFVAPPFLKSGPVSEPILKRACAVLGLERDQVLDSNWIDNGPGWFVMILESAEMVKKLKFDPSQGLIEGDDQEIEGGFFGVVGPYPKGKELMVERGLIPSEESQERSPDSDPHSPHFEVRAFVLEENIEDPVTGSFNAGLAKYLISKGLAPDQFVASQGTNLGRNGRVFVKKVGQDILIGGDVVACIEGEALI